MSWWCCGFAQTRWGQLCVYVLHLPWKSKSLRKSILGRALWCQRRNSGKYSFIKQLQQLLHVLPYAHAVMPPFLSISHILSATNILAQSGDKVVFNLNLCRHHSPSLTNRSYIPGAFVPLTPTIPSEWPALSCPTRNESPKYTHRGQFCAGSTAGTAAKRQG